MIALSELRDSAQKAFSADGLSPDRDQSWKRITEMGWLLIGLPEADGGLGLGAVAAATIHLEMGRMLSRAPLFPALLGLQAVAASKTLVDRQDWIERLSGGAYLPLHLLPAKVSVADDGAVSGTIAGVFDADMADHVLAGLPGQYALIPLGAETVEVVERPMWDKSRRLFDVVLREHRVAPAHVVAQGEAARLLHDALSCNAQLGLAADAIGGAEAILAQSVDYLGMRKQFDRPLAMFQALKHRCADLKIAISGAEALMWSLARGQNASTVEWGAMKALACDTYRLVTEEAIQLHGGIGLTQEHPCHLFMKRAMLNLQLCGALDHWQEARGKQALESLADAG